NFAAALQLADKLIGQGRRSSHMLVMRGASYVGLGQLGAGERDLRAAVEHPRPSGWAYIHLANVYVKQGRQSDAVATLVRGLLDHRASGPRTRDYLDRLKEVWRLHGDPPDAAQVVATLCAELPNDPEVWALDAYVRARRGDSQASLNSLERASALGL